MIRWIPYAFVRIVLFFILGICVGIYYPDIFGEDLAKLWLVILVTLYFIFAAMAWKRRWLHQAVAFKISVGSIGLMALFLAGYLNVLLSTDIRKQDHLLHIQGRVEFYKAVVTAPPKEKNRSWKTEAAVEFINTGGKWIPCQANVLLYFSKEDPPFRYGDVLFIKGQPQLVAGPPNPEEFDYKQFLSFKNIYHQHFVRSGDVKLIGYQPRSWLEHYALISRAWADAVLKKYVISEREQGIASALVLGVTDGLDNELLSAYKATGAMHVLAVSGLHVGIIYGLLLFILKPLNKVKYGPWILAGVSIIVLWIYAFITGLSPSVLRAVTMFSFVALAKPHGHRTNLYNTLAASAFFILLYDPYLLMSVGFQLSYMAVLGIVYLQSGLYNLWEPANWVIDEVWKVTCVSIAAQLATFSIGLLYFNQFPNYFLLSNLFVIPGSFVVLIMGLVMLVVNFIQPVATLLGFLLEWIIKILNFIVFTIEDFPFSVIENVYITTFQCWLLIAILVALLIVIQTKKFKWFLIASFLGVIFSVVRWNYFQEHINIQKLTIYKVNGHTAIDMIDHGQTFFIADSALLKDQGKIQFHITPNRIKAGVNKAVHIKSHRLQQLSGCFLLVWKGKTFMRIYDRNFSLPSTLAVDYVIISNNAVEDLTALCERIKADQFILDSSNSIYSATKLIEQTKNTQTKIYSVSHQGALDLYI